MGPNGHVRRSVLVVEDEHTIADLVARYLTRAGYATRVAHDGPQALAAVAAQRADVIVLDVMMPGLDGLGVMRRVRQHDRDGTAFILLTAKGEEQDRITGLRLGADDYIAKPFSPAELVARVDAVLRRLSVATRGDDTPLEFGELRIEPVARRVMRGGEDLALTVREFDLLLQLARHPGRAFARDQLMEAVWQFSFYTDTATVTVHVRRLRAKLEDDPSRPRWLQTVRGIGYRFQP